MLEVLNAAISFPAENGPFKAVKNISFSIGAGERVAVVGESGSGKSVTAHALLGLLPKKAHITGNAYWQGTQKTVDLFGINESLWPNYRGKEIAMVFQEPMSALNPTMPCGKQVEEALPAELKTHHSRKQRVLQLFQEVLLPHPERIWKAYPFELSGGQRQRVMLAMALAGNPRLLVADEPTTALDVSVAHEMIQLIHRLSESRGLAVLFISHDLHIVRQLASRVLVMFRGELVDTFPIEAMDQADRHPYTKALIQCRPANAKKGTPLPVIADFLSPETKSTRLDAIPEPTSLRGELMIKQLGIAHFSHPFLGRKQLTWQLKPLNIELKRGKTLGIMGESGSGKSTFARLVMGLMRPDDGFAITWNGHQVAFGAQWRKTIQMVYQDPNAALNSRWTILQTLSEPLKIKGISTAQCREKAIELLNKVQLDASFLAKYPGQCSGGQKQRISIARALAMEPDILILDESVAALDVSVQAEVLNLLVQLQQAQGLTYLFVSHDLHVLRYMADDLLVLHHGEVAEYGAAENICKSPQHPYTRRLLAAAGL